MTPTLPPNPGSPSPEEPEFNAAQRAAIAGLLALTVCPEPVTGFVGGVLLSLGKTLVNRWRAAGAGPRARAAAARRRYEAALRLLGTAGLDGIELHAAREAALQRYLRELAEVLR